MNCAKINLRPGEWPWLFISHPKITLVAPLLLHSRTIRFLFCFVQSFSSSDDVGFSQWKTHPHGHFPPLLPDHTNPFLLALSSSPSPFLPHGDYLYSPPASPPCKPSLASLPYLLDRVLSSSPQTSMSHDYASSFSFLFFSSSRSHDPLFICLSMYNCCFVPSCCFSPFYLIPFNSPSFAHASE